MGTYQQCSKKRLSIANFDLTLICGRLLIGISVLLAIIAVADNLGLFRSEENKQQKFRYLQHLGGADTAENKQGLCIECHRLKSLEEEKNRGL